MNRSRHRSSPSSSCWPRVVVFASAAPPRRATPAHRVRCRARPASATAASRASSSAERRGAATGTRGRARRRARAPRPAELVTVGAARPGRRTSRPTPRRIGVTRRQFFNRSIVVVHGPRPVRLRRRGARLPVAAAQGRLRLEDPGRQDHRHPDQDHRRQGLLLPAPRAACGSRTTRRPRSTRPRQVYPPAGARRAWRPASSSLYQKCPHLGCRVPSCVTSQWFECPCHGSQYNQVGEKKGGPAPRGMDRFATEVVRRRAHRRHRHRHPGPADRHQHHRPGGRRSPLRRGSGH